MFVHSLKQRRRETACCAVGNISRFPTSTSSSFYFVAPTPPPLWSRKKRPKKRWRRKRRRQKEFKVFFYFVRIFGKFEVTRKKSFKSFGCGQLLKTLPPRLFQTLGWERVIMPSSSFSDEDRLSIFPVFKDGWLFCTNDGPPSCQSTGFIQKNLYENFPPRRGRWHGIISQNILSGKSNIYDFVYVH